MRTATWTLGLATVLALGACSVGDDSNDERFREAQQVVDDAADAQAFLDDALEACMDEHQSCVDGGGDAEQCDEALHDCLGQLPGPEVPDPADPEIPDFPDPEVPDPGDIPDFPEPGDFPDFPEPGDFPELPDIGDFGGVCLEELSTCVGTEDLATCAEQAHACFQDAIAGICSKAHQFCIDAGAPPEMCQQLVDHCG